MMTTFKNMVLFASFFSSVAFADEVLIHAVVGDQTSSFLVRPAHEEYLLSLNVNFLKKGQSFIGKKNYDYTVRKAQEVIAMKPAKNTVCDNRDASYLEYKNAVGKSTRVDFCFTDGTEQSTDLRSLVNVMMMSLY